MFPFTAAGSAPRASQNKSANGVLSGAPGLRGGVERLVAAVVKNLQTMAGETTVVEGTVSGIAAMQIRDVVASHRPEAVATTISCAGLPCTLLVTLDPILVYALVELLTGGNGSEALPEVARAVTAIDGQYTQLVATLIASGIEKEWAANGFGAARAQRVESGLSNDVCGARIPHVGVITVTLVIFGLRGTAVLVLPPAALDAFPQGEAAEPDEARRAPDPEWSALLQRELGRAPVKVDAFLQAQRLPLGAIAQLKAGDVVELAPMARSRAALVCDGQILYHGELGLDGNSFCVRIAEPATPPASSDGLRQRSRPLVKTGIRS